MGYSNVLDLVVIVILSACGCLLLSKYSYYCNQLLCYLFTLSDVRPVFFSGGWTITGTPLDLHDPRILAVAAAQRHLLEAEYDEYAATNASGAAFCRSAALIVSPFC
jgi:hypothetical protein